MIDKAEILQMIDKAEILQMIKLKKQATPHYQVTYLIVVTGTTLEKNPN